MSPASKARMESPDTQPSTRGAFWWCTKYKRDSVRWKACPVNSVTPALSRVYLPERKFQAQARLLNCSLVAHGEWTGTSNLIQQCMNWLIFISFSSSENTVCCCTFALTYTEWFIDTKVLISHHSLLDSCQNIFPVSHFYQQQQEYLVMAMSC